MNVNDWLVPVRIVPVSDGAHVFVDSWDYEDPIAFSLADLPEDVVHDLRAGAELVIAEARVNLGAEDKNDVVNEIIKSISITADDEFWENYES